VMISVFMAAVALSPERPRFPRLAIIYLTDASDSRMVPTDQAGAHFSFTFPVLACAREGDVERVDHFPLYELGKTLVWRL